MRGWSFPFGRLFGVDLRVHTFFLLLLGISISYASVPGDVSSGSGFRGFGLWFLLLLALAVRETARAIVSAWYGLDLRTILLLPTGGLTSYASQESNELASRPDVQRTLAFVGPISNIAFGILLAALVTVISPAVDLFSRPWIAPSHLLRSAIWINLLLGVINFLPASPLDGGRLFAGGFGRTGMKGLRSSSSIGQILSIGMVVAGLLLPNMWLILLGVFVLIGARLEDQSLLLQNDVDAVRMRDVMLVEFSTLSASDTLEDALQRSIHCLQDVFPVVRGPNLVGAVSRQNILEALQAGGNGYIQGVMSRSFQTAQPDDSLVKTLRRISTGHGAQLVPVLEGHRIVGIITPQNLAHSMGLLTQQGRLQQNRSHAD